ncbi:MAG: gamma-glutamyltransferase [Candidatus Caldarchaeales archaeon]
MSSNTYSLGRIAIATHSPLTSKIALEIIQDGGNAVDAAVTASLLLNILEPGWSGIGGGGFALVYSEDHGVKALDYREVAPLKVRLEEYRSEEDISIGYRAVAVPGTLKGLWMMHQEFGEVEWHKIIEIVIRYAESCQVSGLWSKCMSKDLDRAMYKLRICSESYRTFLRDGEIYPENSTISFRNLGETMKMLKQGIEYFYEGELAEEVETIFFNNGGFLSSKDLSGYRAIWRDPIIDEVQICGKTLKIAAMPPPSSAVLLIEALKILSQMKLDGDYYLKLVYLLSHIIDERYTIISDPIFNEVDVERLLSETHIREALESIKNRRFTFHTSRDSGGTSQISIADSKNKMYVSLTETIECFMGSGITVRGILLNDEMHDFELQRDHPNVIYPGKRPASSMSPMIIFDEEEHPLAVLGASGGMRILSSIIQTLLNYFIRGLDPVSSIIEGRVHVRRDNVVLEDIISEKVQGSLLKAGLKIGEVREVSMHPGIDLYFGAVQAVFRKDDLFLAVSDLRKQPGAYAR